jgi:hypothetical protein
MVQVCPPVLLGLLAATGTLPLALPFILARLIWLVIYDAL